MDDGPDGRRYVVVARVPRQIEVRIEDAFLSMVSTSRPTMGFHITLLGPFFIRSGGDESCRFAIAEVCREAYPVAVRIGGVSAFTQDDDSAVYLHVEGGAPLEDLHWALLEKTTELIEAQYAWAIKGDADYHPHVTLGLRLTDRELQAFTRAVDPTALEASFLVSELWLAQEEPGAPWRFVGSFPLGASDEESEPTPGDWPGR